MKAKLITYSITKQPIPIQNQLRKQLNGHNDTSHQGKYTYHRKGLLNTITHIKPSKGTIIAPTKEAEQIIALLKNNQAEIKTYDIQINKSAFKQ